MHLDVLDLRTFYYRTNLGRAVQKAITAQVRELWPEATAQTVVGFGFAAPLLRPFLTDARRVIGLMPGPQGVMPWPQGLPNVSVLCEDARWPLSTGFVDKLLVMHGLETSENPSAVLEECGRVLGPGGRALFVVPNRSGVWARSDQTPFGYGRPYSMSQLESQLDRHGFVAERHAVALFQPPSHRKFWLRAGGFCENFGQRVSRIAGGVLILEVSKRSMASGGELVKDKRPVVLPVLEGLSQPARDSHASVQPKPSE